MTRAMQQLYLTHARRRRVFGDFQINPRSRFIDEIPADLLHELASVAPAARTAAAPAASSARGGHRVADEGVHLVYGEEGVRIVYDGEDGIRIGSRVRHATFGVGTVQHLEGSGEKQKATVRFQSAGTRKLVVKFAGLEPA
jgi:DNA helicase-2/ATP-dependent DNA helicase PcrA